MDTQEIKARLERAIKFLVILRNYGLYPAVVISAVLSLASALSLGMTAATFGFVANTFIGLLAVQFNQWCENKMRSDIEALGEYDRQAKIKDLNPHR